ncbi:MAG: hypothetical protein KDA65_09975 [Planctomycetaceae bacterium]|nr:hypothetical protein [Planctomycetaceae bacterium]
MNSTRKRKRWFNILLIVVAIPLLAYGGFKWRGHQRQKWIEEFVRTTNIENNPWGIEQGMDDSEVLTRLGLEHYVGSSMFSITSSTSHLFLEVEHDQVLWTVTVTNPPFFDTESDNTNSVDSLRVTFDRTIEPAWIQWLKSYLPWGG